VPPVTLPPSGSAERFAELAKIAEAQQRKERIEDAVKIATEVFSAATAYTNVVIIAGYAAFFALWGSTKDIAPKSLILISGLSMIISASAFVFFEVYKMIYVSFSMRKQAKILTAAKDPLPELRAYREASKAASLIFMKVWIATLLVVIPTTLVGIAALVYGYVDALVTA
jgi:hypothetical protein